MIPLIPLSGAVFNVFLGARLARKNAGLLACTAVAISFLLSVFVVWRLPDGGTFRDLVFTWIESGPFKAEIAVQVDALTSVMLLIVTGIGLLIHIYSLGYMGHDEDMVRYFVYLNLFIFFMLLLVMADNLLLFFVGWEGVGLCSCLLIGFWHEEEINVIAGNKAFIVNRIGDFGFILGILLLLTEMSRQGVWSLNFLQLKESAQLLSAETVTLVTLLLFAGATGKSAQIPLYVWLPDAMQGPTPVSALIHAATMVTAGIYMTARLYFLFSLAPATLAVIAIIGALTAFFAATIALVQSDIKRVLAYSTVSQLGYMFVAVGVGAFSTAIFHLMTQAFIKACLFLSAGSVIHALHGEQSMRKMGGLKANLPVTYWTYLIAALAISGAPLTAGFFSKDQIIFSALASPGGSVWLWVFLWITAGLTAFYTFRQFFMVFHGKSHVDEHLNGHIHESPSVMTLPLILLALGSIFAGWLGAPEYMWGSAWDRWLGPLFSQRELNVHGGVTSEVVLTILTAGLAGLGIFLAYVFYGRKEATPEGGSSGSLYRLLANKYYVDEFYDFLLVQPFTAISRWLATVFDAVVIDGVVNGVGNSVRGSGLFWRRLQTGNVQYYLLAFLMGTVLVLAYFLFG